MKHKLLLSYINTITLLIIFIALFIQNNNIEGFSDTIVIPSSSAVTGAPIPATLFTSTSAAGTDAAPTSGKGNVYSVIPPTGLSVPKFVGSTDNVSFIIMSDFIRQTNARLSLIGTKYANLAINYADTVIGTATANIELNNFQSYLIAVNKFIDDNLIPNILNQGATDTNFTPDLNIFTYLPGTYWLTSSQLNKLKTLVTAFNTLPSPNEKRNVIKQVFLIMKPSSNTSQSELFDIFNITLSNYLTVPAWIHKYYENGDVPSFATDSQKTADEAISKIRVEYNKLLAAPGSKVSNLPPPADTYTFYTAISTSTVNQILDALQRFTQTDLNNRNLILSGSSAPPSPANSIDMNYLYIGVPMGVVVLGLVGYIAFSGKPAAAAKTAA